MIRISRVLITIILLLLHFLGQAQAFTQYTEEMVLSIAVDGIKFKEDFDVLHENLLHAGFMRTQFIKPRTYKYQRDIVNAAGKKGKYLVQVRLHKDATVERIIFTIPYSDTLTTNFETLRINAHFQNNDLCKSGRNPLVACKVEFIENGHTLKFIANLYGKKRHYRLVRANEAPTGGGGGEGEEGQAANSPPTEDTAESGAAASTSQAEAEPSDESDTIADLLAQAQQEQSTHETNQSGGGEEDSSDEGVEGSDAPEESDQGESSQGESLLDMAQSGDAQAQYELAMQHEALSTNSTSHAQAAMEYYEMASEQGHAGAQFRLANMLAANEGITESVIELLEDSAENGNNAAAFMLGMQHLLGNATEQNDAEALQYFQQAAAQNYLPAMEALALMYEHGLGIEPDMQMANKLRADAAKIEAQQGDQVGMYGSSNFDIDLPTTSNVLPF